MSIKLKRVEDQVIVITGGTSGIGLATAKRAAKRGARVVLCSRNEPELRGTVDGDRAERRHCTFRRSRRRKPGGR